ncbi:hypothetical protein CI109_103526 [Kwoniella shandongensis]|uniref:Uncharacterized protein n=1 Tax=Kwoniella shandongensis TaxID=1734106 RepID=A0A5M6BW07_9TREE|nr:uncharacterized protein CI109_004572 [Kwoniella shandongensis]KAA5527037.1 hypothetical protein CI109_004572 [Kwoniella shandongensis]
MSAPIPINKSTTTPPHQSHATMSAIPMPSTTPTSAVSISPQTPFFPPPGLPASTTPTQPTSIFKWAASLGKSPSPPTQTKTFDWSEGYNSTSLGAHAEEHEHEHDSFEFGDFNDIKSRPWAQGRRTMSMSAGPSATGQSGIAAMLKNGGGVARESISGPPAGQATLGVGSVPTGGVMADKVAKGQGVLRRLSLSGSAYRPPFFSPPSQNSVLLPSPPAVDVKSVPPPPAPTPAIPVSEATVQRAVTLGATNKPRGRRFSENGARKRGVSPMGERLLRDHGHF